MEPSTSTSVCTKSKLSQQNALLAQLLSQRAARETVVNTQLTVNPTGVPTNRLTRNVNNRMLLVKGKNDEPSSSMAGDAGNSSSGVGTVVSSSNIGPNNLDGMGSRNANIHSNPLTDPNTPFPGNTTTSSNPDSTGNLVSVFDDLNDDPTSSQFSDQVSQFVSDFEARGVEAGVGRSEETDPLLQQILQQAASLEQDIFEKKASQWPGEGVATNNMPDTPSGSAVVTSTRQSRSISTPSTHLQNPLTDGLAGGLSVPSNPQQTFSNTPSNLLPPQQTFSNTPSNLLPPQQLFSLTPLDQVNIIDDDQNVLLQLEQILAGDVGFQVESFLNLVSSSTPSPPVSLGQGQPGVTSNTYNEQLAISAIQRQLMNDDPIGNIAAPSGPGTVMGNGGPLRSPTGHGVYPSQPPLSPATGMGPRSMMGQPVRHSQMMGQMGMGPRSFPAAQISPQPPALSPGQQQQQPQGPMFSPAGMPSQNPQFQQPGPLANVLQSGQQQVFAPRIVGNAGGVGVPAVGASPVGQVRQTLLKQQQNRQLEKKQRQQQQQQQQERQRMMQQQQQQQRMLQSQTQQAPHQFSPRFPVQQSNMTAGMDPVTSPGQFPENLRDLMNTGHAPNVTIPPQGGQFTVMSGRHRSLSGNAIPNSTPPQAGQGRFQFSTEGQFSSQNQMPMFSPPGQPQVQMPSVSNAAQQQQMFQQQQNRHLQRSISMNTGRGSPRTSQSPFAGSPDPLLSPHAMSPNSAVRQQQAPQVSPTFSQGAMTSTGYNQPGPPSYSVSSVHSSVTATSQPFPDFSDFSDVFGNAMSDSKKMSSDLAMSASPNTMQQFVKQELRNICSARSEKNMQTQLQQHLHQKLHHHQQQQQQQPSPQQQQPHQPQSMQHTSMDYESHSELPLDILETINDMRNERGSSMPTDEVLVKEEEMVAMARKEAKVRYNQFRALSSSSNPGSVVAETVAELDEAEVKAASLFRAQLQTPMQHTASSGSNMSASSAPPVVVQTEPRPSVDVKPNETKNSLLQQLLADV